MQSKVPKPPTYLRHRTKDKAFVYVRGEDGKRRQIYLAGRYDSPESHRAYREVVGRVMAGDPEPTAAPAEWQDGGVTVETVVAGFLEHAEVYYRKPDGTPTRELPNYVLVARPLLRLYRDELAATFGPLKLKRVREEMIARGWARPTINKQVDLSIRQATSENGSPWPHDKRPQAPHTANP